MKKGIFLLSLLSIFVLSWAKHSDAFMLGCYTYRAENDGNYNLNVENYAQWMRNAHFNSSILYSSESSRNVLFSTIDRKSVV